MRTYSQAIDYLNRFINYERSRSAPYSAETLNLDRMRALLARLGDPQRAYPTIHIAGTKGKGSTAALADAILRAAGYRTGLYTSPHLHTFRERMRVDGAPIEPGAFAALVDEIEPHAAAVAGITWFEIVTGLAFLHFARQAIDAGVIEVGLGGRFDATNVIAPGVCAITSLSMDHMAWLGHTLDQIAFEKAGIIKPGVPVVSAPQKPEALTVIVRAAAERNAPLTVIGRDIAVDAAAASLDGQTFALRALDSPPDSARQLSKLTDIPFTIPLLGRHQIENAALAAAAVALDDALPVDAEAVGRGLAAVRWPGRLEVARRDPPLIFDGAHNDDSARRLASALADLFPGARWTLVFGASADKDAGGMIDALAPLAARFIATRSRSARAGDVESIAEAAAARGLDAEVAAGVAEAVDRAVAGGGAVVVTGSLFVVAEAREAWFERIGAPIVDRDA